MMGSLTHRGIMLQWGSRPSRKRFRSPDRWLYFASVFEVMDGQKRIGVVEMSGNSQWTELLDHGRRCRDSRGRFELVNVRVFTQQRPLSDEIAVCGVVARKWGNGVGYRGARAR